MAKTCETLDHVADVGLLARADSAAELFEALAEGLVDLICSRRHVRASRRRRIEVQAEDREALAVDFLSQVLWVLQTERFAVAAVRVSSICDHSVTAELTGEPLDLQRHEIDTEVKAVTYHQLLVSQDRDGWTGRVILDI